MSEHEDLIILERVIRMGLVMAGVKEKVNVYAYNIKEAILKKYDIKPKGEVEI